MRNHYESLEDLKRQSAALKRLALAFKFEIMETPPGASFDAFVYGSIIAGLVEYKARDIKNINRIDHIFLSAHKYRAIKNRIKNGLLRFFFMIEIADGSLWISDLTNTDLAIHKGSGRTKKTRDNMDIEDCIHIPRSYFTRVKE